MNRAVLFRVDAGPQVGLGHLQRCLGLAAALHRGGITCVFLVSPDRAVQRRVASFRVEPLRLNGAGLGSTEDARRTLEAAARYACDAVVVDSYDVDADYLRQLRTYGLVVVAISDQARFPYPCQYVVNGGPHAPGLAYRASADDTRFLLGSQYALLGSEFWDIPARRVHSRVTNVLITLGGANQHQLMSRLLCLLDDLPGAFSVTAVRGPFVDDRHQIARVASNCRRVVDLVRGPDTLLDVMLKADLAISAGGHTLYELAATGTPTVAVETADNQAENVRAMAAQGSVRAVGRADDPSVLAACEAALQRMFEDREARRAMSAAGQRVVDGRGAQRVAHAVAGTDRSTSSWRA